MAGRTIQADCEGKVAGKVVLGLPNSIIAGNLSELCMVTLNPLQSLNAAIRCRSIEYVSTSI